jgi:hypothetical protein
MIEFPGKVINQLRHRLRPMITLNAYLKSRWMPFVAIVILFCTFPVLIWFMGAIFYLCLFLDYSFERNLGMFLPQADGPAYVAFLFLLYVCLSAILTMAPALYQLRHKMWLKSFLNFGLSFIIILPFLFPYLIIFFERSSLK